MHLPDAGDIVWVEFDPVLGSEQAGRRPALVLTAHSYHAASRRAVVCPITSNTRPWPWKVALPQGLRTGGVVLVDQIRAIDRHPRMFDFIERVPGEVMAEVWARLVALIGIDVSGVSSVPRRP